VKAFFKTHDDCIPGHFIFKKAKFLLYQIVNDKYCDRRNNSYKILENRAMETKLNIVIYLKLLAIYKICLVKLMIHVSYLSCKDLNKIYYI
jgi:hypothetical protein